VKRSASVLVEVEIDMPDFSHVFLGPAGNPILHGIHSNEYYVELEGVSIGLELERQDQSLLGAD